MEKSEQKKKNDAHNKWKKTLIQRAEQWKNMDDSQRKEHYQTILTDYPPCSEKRGYVREMEKL